MIIIDENSVMIIDLASSDDYYSPMKFKSQFIYAFLLLNITACGHVNKQPVVFSTPNTHTGGKSTLDETALSRSEQNTQKNVHDDDLLARIRAGFTWPELKSKHTEDYVNWNSRHHTYLTALFERAQPFLFHIVEEIEKRGLPMELALLPAIESSFKPNAISRSRAAGLWQFIPSTGSYLGLQKNNWLDERRDLIKATATALDYLTYLNNEVNGDWFLTLAAYNAGIGTVQRAIKKNKKKRRGTLYQDLDLRSETVRYIPKLLALRRIIQNPEKYNLELPKIDNKPYFQEIALNNTAPIDLSFLAKKIDIEFNELHRLNANFLNANIPAFQKTSNILVPIAKAAMASQLIADQENNPLIEYIYYAINHGDTLSTVARKHHVTIATLQSINNLSNSRIRAGKTLLIPYRQKQPTVGTPSLTALEQQRLEQASSKKVYRVKAGDTLWSIAKHYQVQLQQLISWNNISANQILRLNQPLLIFSN